MGGPAMIEGGGLGAVGFRESIRLFQTVFWHVGSPTLAYLRDLPWWWKVLAPASGGLVVGLITPILSVLCVSLWF